MSIPISIVLSLVGFERKKKVGHFSFKRMAKYRSVNTKFWTDGYIRRLPPDGKLLFLYLITNPLTSISGAYETTIEQICYDTCMDSDKVLTLLSKFKRDSKIVFKNGWLLVLNFLKHQSRNPKVNKGIELALNDAPKWIQDRLSIGYVHETDSLSHLNSYLNSYPNPISDISNDISKPEKKSRPKKSLTPLPENFEVTEEMQRWFSENCPRLDLEEETKAFRLRCEAKGTEYKDWIAGWKTQMANAEKWLKEKSGNGSHAPTNGYDLKKDMLSPEFEMPPATETDFEMKVSIQKAMSENDPDTYHNRQKYEMFKADFLVRHPGKYLDQVERYERSLEFGKRFSETGPAIVSTGVNAGRG